MPSKPKRPCRMTGCPNLADDGELYCSAHKQTAAYEYNHYRRDPETKKRYGRAWKRIRDRHIREHPLCEECLKHGIVPFIIEDDLKYFYYRGLSQWDKEKGYLMDTCLTAQDRFKAYLDYFRIGY